MEFLACVHHEDTYVNGKDGSGLVDKRSVKTRIAELEQLAQEAYAACEERARADGRDYLPYVFLAPEYFFSRGANRHFLEHHKKHQIVDAIRKLSAAEFGALEAELSREDLPEQSAVEIRRLLLRD